jgi:hypothetical protein
VHAEWRVAIGDDEVPAVFDPAEPSDGRAVFVCAHGAGGHMTDRGMVAVTNVLRARGLATVRFNFLYREKRSSYPDRMPQLMECFAAVAARARQELAPDILIIGGRSMGGRAASMLAADGLACDGLLLLAYPLHPAGRVDQLRDAHLSAITVPVLCINGTRDALCQRDLMEKALTTVGPRWEMEWLEGADHSFHVLKSSGTTDAAVLQGIGERAAVWVRDAVGQRTHP